jgi:hypothetical protein
MNDFMQKQGAFHLTNCLATNANPSSFFLKCWNPDAFGLNLKTLRTRFHLVQHATISPFITGEKKGRYTKRIESPTTFEQRAFHSPQRVVARHVFVKTVGRPVHACMYARPKVFREWFRTVKWQVHTSHPLSSLLVSNSLLKGLVVRSRSFVPQNIYNPSTGGTRWCAAFDNGNGMMRERRRESVVERLHWPPIVGGEYDQSVCVEPSLLESGHDFAHPNVERGNHPRKRAAVNVLDCTVELVDEVLRPAHPRLRKGGAGWCKVVRTNVRACTPFADSPARQTTKRRC